MNRFLQTALLIAVVALSWAIWLTVDSPDHGRTSRNYIVLHQVERPTASETVTAWDAYEAAPQEATTPAAAVERFKRDSGLEGTFRAIPEAEWRP